MSQPLLTESSDKNKQRIARREPHPASARSFQAGPSPLLQLQRTLGNYRVAQLIKAGRLTPEGRIIGGRIPELQSKLTVGAADDQYEQEADQRARHAINMPEAGSIGAMQHGISLKEDKNKTLQTKPLVTSTAHELTHVVRQTDGAPSGREKRPLNFLSTDGPAQEISAGGLKGTAQQLPFADQIQASFGRHSIAGISAHLGGPAADASAALGAHAYATGNSVAFGHPPDLHTAAHEAAHVIQQRAGLYLKDGMGQPGDTHERHADSVANMVVQGKSAEGLLDQYGGAGGDSVVQCSFNGSFPIPGSTSGFEADMQTRSLAAGDTMSGLDGYIRFVPAAGSPNSNVIAMHQIVRTTNVLGGDINSVTTPADRQARGQLGDPGIRTEVDATTGVEGGFKTDVHHQGGGAGAVPQGSPLSPRYPFEPTRAGQPTQVGSVQQPAQYGGGIGGHIGQTPGFKRSDEAHDMKAAALYDTPGTPGPGGDFDQAFESVARGEDTNINYGTIRWGQSIRGGEVTSEVTPVVTAGSTATFDVAQERHRDFYVHEPVTFYFEFDKDEVGPGELAKIDAFVPYLNRIGNADVLMSLQGFADQIGNVAYNIALSRRRAENVQAAIVGRGIAAARIDMPPVAHGISTAATDATSEVPAGSGDQGGTAATGADQNREANRWANRRVVLTFRHPAPAAGGAPAPAPAPGP